MGTDKRVNWPIIEVVAEFFFEPSPPWDNTVPGLVFAQLEHQFPTREQRRVVNTRLDQDGKDIRQTVEIIDRSQFFDRDRTALIQVNENLLTANRLKPYTSWEEFAPIIEQALGVYVDISGQRRLKRTGLRFINDIEFNLNAVPLQDYFDFYPHLGSGLPQELAAFHCQVIHGRPNLGNLIFTISTGNHGDIGANHVRLDLYCLAEQTPLDKAIEWMDQAHNELNTTFKAVITEKLLKRFRGDAE